MRGEGREVLPVIVLSAWLMGSLVIAFVATQNFRAVDRVLQAAPDHPELARQIERMGATDVRLLLRHLASEMNRFYFRAWGWSQLLLALLLLGGLWRSGWPDRVVSGSVLAMLAIVLVFVFSLTPAIVAMGRQLDFAPRNPPPPSYAHFWRLHMAYTLLDLVKMGLGVLSLIRLVRSL